MKFITIIAILHLQFFSLLSVAGEWKKITKGKNGHTFYLIPTEIIEKGKYVYFWQLVNYMQRDQYGDLSAKIYVKGDCQRLKFKWLRISYHKEFMAKDYAHIGLPSDIVSDWQFPEKNTTSESVLKFACTNKLLFL